MALHMMDSGNEDFFMIRITRHDGTLYAHAVGSLTDVAERIEDNRYHADVNDEFPDVAEVWHLGVLTHHQQVTVTPVLHGPIGFLEYQFTWDAVMDGTLKARTESTYHKIGE